MDDVERERLRRLAVWLACRREVDEVVAQLTAYGPAASEQVSTHLEAVKELLAREAEAFAAVEAASEVAPQVPLPAAEPLPASVHSLTEARSRRDA